MELSDLRRRLDDIDQQLTQLFIQRMQLMDDVAACKARLGLAVRDPQRESQVLAQRQSQAPQELQDDVAALYRLLFERASLRQQEIIRRLGERRL